MDSIQISSKIASKEPFSLNYDSARMIHFEISPVPKLRARKGKNGSVYTPNKTRKFERELKFLAKEYMQSKKPFQTPIAVNVTFYVEKPKTIRRSVPCVKPDLDNLLKSTLDALNKVLWKDDNIICELAASKRYGDPGILVMVVPIDDGIDH